MNSNKPSPRVILLANGAENRWQHFTGVPKQMVLFNGEPNIQRTIRLAAAYTADIWVVTWNPDICPKGATFLKVEPTEWLAQTMNLSRPIWNGRTIILLGDVFFSARAFQRIFRDQHALVFFGRIGRNHYTGCGHSELFGVAFDPSTQARLAAALDAVLNGIKEGQLGKLWQVYNQASGMPAGSKKAAPDIFCQIADYTDDIDTPEEYLRVKTIYSLAAQGTLKARLELLGRLVAIRARRRLSPIKQRVVRWLNARRSR